MKNLVLLVLFLLLSFSATAQNDFLDNFQLERFNENFYGIAGNSQNILLFGDWGGVMRSIDSGKTWKKFSIDENYFVMDIIEAGYFYGVLNQDYIIKSFDNGATWEKSFIGNYKFHRIAFYKNQLYCLAENKIIVCNTSLEIIKQYDIITNKINGNRKKAVGDQYDFEIFNDKIYYISDTTELSEIDMQTNKTRKINLKNFGHILNDRVPSNLMRINDKLYFTINVDLYSFVNDKLELVQNEKKLSIWATNTDDIFYMNSISLPSSIVDSITFNKIIPNHQPQKIIQGKPDRYISHTRFKALKFLSDNIVLAAGENKLIYISFNKGKNWKLISHLDLTGSGPIFQLDNKNFFYVGGKVKFIYSTNDGLTWLPQKKYSTYFNSEHRFNQIFNYGLSTGFANKGIAFYETPFKKDTNFIISEQNGEVTRLLNNDAVIGYPSNYGVSNIRYSFFKHKDKLFFTHNSGIMGLKWIFSFLFTFDDNMFMSRRHLFDSAHVEIMDTFDDGNIYGLTINYKDPQKYRQNEYNYKGSLSLIKSGDDGQTFKTIADYPFFTNRISLDQFYLENFEKIDDEIFFYHSIGTDFDKNEIYSINIKTKELNKIGMMPDSFSTMFYGVQKINATYYFNCNKILLDLDGKIILKLFSNKDPKNYPDNWQEVIIPQRYSKIYLSHINDNIFYISVYDSLINDFVKWFARPKTTTKVGEQTEVQTALYNTVPYPNPASNFVRTKIYWDLRYDIEKSDISVYDYTGNKVAGHEALNLDRLNNYSGILTWDCSKYNSGLYFIVIKHGDATRSIPVIVNR